MDQRSDKTKLLELGKTQVDAIFASQANGLALDDSEFFPLIEVVLMAFEAHRLG